MKNLKAFTLVEILIVVGIIALLAGVAIPNFLRSRVNANQAYAQATLKTIAHALENYSALNHIYPATTTELVAVTPPYLNVDYFLGTHYGYTYTSVLASYSYTITAAPVSSGTGTSTFTVTTGGVLQAF